ncbi:hypothetical protein CSUI_005480 [Cystoisospora suis]|uniref:Uncharacterized protein n=1 Tax=Cystoisospora suis TaxID=483139 RepID=A0A2C6KJJ9_9APIC|nr:hypothetical protein CSUI_005480 [Cystoisospora suis]
MSLSTFLLRPKTACASFSLPQRAAPPKPKKPSAAKKKVKKEGGGLPQHLTRYLPFVPTSLVHETTSFLHDPNKLRSLLSLIYSPNKDVPRSSSEKDSSSSSSSSSVSLQDRLEYQMELEEYLTVKEHHTAFYRRHESNASASMWRAIEALPADLYEEAVQSVTYEPPYVNEPPPAPSSPSSSPFSQQAAESATLGKKKIDSAESSQQQSRGDGKTPSLSFKTGSVDTPENEVMDEEEKDQHGKKDDRTPDYFLERFHFPRALMFHEMYGKQIFDSLDQTERRKLQVYMNLMHIRYPHAELKKEKPELFWLPERQVLSRQREGSQQKRKAAK